MKRYSAVRRLPFTVLGIVFLGIMLFPVYWMINTSLQSGRPL